MMRFLQAIAASLLFSLAALAQDRVDTTLYHRYDRLFSTVDADSVQAFYEVSEQIKEQSKKRGDLDRYYEILINEISYDASHDDYIGALKKAQSIMDDIQGENHVGPQYYGHVYKSLGSIFEHRGSYQMSNFYYERALTQLQPDPNGHMPEKQRNLIGNIFASLARVNLYYAVDKSWYWNELLGQHFGHDPHFRKPYLSHKARLHFYRHQIDSFLIVKHQFDEFIKSPEAPQYSYGERRLNLMENAVSGRLELALRQIDSIVEREPMTINAAMRIHDALGCKDLALKDAYRWLHLQDSLNSELVNENLNELNVMLGTDRVQREAAKERQRWLLGVIVLLALVVLLVVARHLTKLSHMRQIEQKNLELEAALEEAKESERMKTSFIQHVSHEMRTPLNIITGNAQIIATPEIELENDDRKRLLEGINEHTVAITSIVNDLLEMSLTSTKGRYQREDTINVNEMGVLAVATKEEKNQGRLDLKFETQLPDDFTIKSNYGGVERILVHLLGNALKFTEKGSVTLTARSTADKKGIEYVVTDTGIGVAPEFHEQIFEHFYKVDQFKQGMGIGLSMARKVAKGLGGSLDIDPTYTGGARFVLRLPLA